MVPHSRHCHTQQSANILDDCCLQWHQGWGTMVATVGSLGYDVSTDVVGWLWVVIYIRIRRVLCQAIGNTFPIRWQWASLLALEPLVGQSWCKIGGYAAPSGHQHHWGMMCGGNDGEIGGIRPGDKFSYMMGLCTSIDHCGCCCPTAAMRPYSWHWSTQQSANILGNRFVLLKLEKIIVYYVY